MFSFCLFVVVVVVFYTNSEIQEKQWIYPEGGCSVILIN